MIGRKLDEPGVFAVLTRLSFARSGFRIRRVIQRVRSPRRIVATALMCLFLLHYILAGVFVLWTRPPADTANLMLWLSGGMVLYSIYHCVRCAWSAQTSDLQMTPAEELWLAGAPLRRSSVAIYQVGELVAPTAMKTVLLAVVLAVDVEQIALLLLGVFSSLLTLEIVRLTIFRWASGLSDRARTQFRWVATAVAAAIALQVMARVVAATPLGSPVLTYVLHTFSCIGETAASDMLQALSLPWICGSRLAVTENCTMTTLFQTILTIAILPTAILILISVDSFSRRAILRREQKRLAARNYRSRDVEEFAAAQATAEWRKPLTHRFTHGCLNEWTAIVSRQWTSIYRYRVTILLSFLVPMLLSLSPLLAGRDRSPWTFIMGGIGMCTMLLAPPALRIDFRRDLKRMLLLKSLPVRPLAMVLGQLTLPILITCIFQWVTIAIAALATGTGLASVVLWTGILNALSVFTFATENALFLAYPHHERAQGLALMIRAKLTFVGKFATLMLSLTLLGMWAKLCTAALPASMAKPALIIGAIAMAWSIAIATVAVATWSWRRFDLSLDLPPE